ncbi:hypothetical protein KIPB_013716, partial [Kipferlia bialata]|eukprot:g13716.t1
MHARKRDLGASEPKKQSRFVRWLDQYGESHGQEETGPTTQPKSVAGAIVSLCVRALFLFLIVAAVMSLWNALVNGAGDVVIGQATQYHATSSRLDVPSLDLAVTYDVVFYNQDESVSPVQNIEATSPEEFSNYAS